MSISKDIYSKALIYIGFFLLISTTSFAKYTNTTYSPDIKSVQLYKNGWPLAKPVITLNTTDQIALSFDDLSGSSETYNYTVVHCTPDWEESGLNPTEYVNGFAVNQILSYKYSYSTTYRYVHYELLLPNRDINFRISGNYILKATKADEETPIFTRRFYVLDNQVSINADIRTPHLSDLSNSSQEINFSIFYPNFKINNPREDIKVIIQQNGREDNMVTNLMPQFLRPDELVYNYSSETTFEGTNEFRWIDFRSLRLYSQRTAKVDFFDPFYHVTITPDYPRTRSNYYLNQDFNGKYVINVQEGRDPNLEADYAFVHLTVPLDAPFTTESLHAIGEAFGWMPTNDNKFLYNFDIHCYELSILLKQGIYDYLLGVKEKGNTKIDFERFEGNNRLTENDYSFFVYYKGITDNYTQLIGIQFANSIRK